MSVIKTQVLSVDTGDAIHNLKEYKKYIEDLKFTLVSLQKGTKDYEDTAKALSDAQKKLNEAMDAAKGSATAVEGSYDYLVATMSDLKKEWRATADEAKRSDLGKQILDINNQLKELDASTGNFQRNVGDYQNAFEEAFRSILGGISRGDSELSKYAGTAASLIPLIKSITKTATASLKGIKGAIASTGIGLLVIAVGELAANWEKVWGWIRKATGSAKDYTKEINAAKEAQKSLQSTITTMGWQAAGEEMVLRAKGLSDVELQEFRITKEMEKQDVLQKEATKTLNNLKGNIKIFADDFGDEPFQIIGFLEEDLIKKAGVTRETIDTLKANGVLFLDTFAETNKELKKGVTSLTGKLTKDNAEEYKIALETAASAKTEYNKSVTEQARLTTELGYIRQAQAEKDKKTARERAEADVKAAKDRAVGIATAARLAAMSEQERLREEYENSKAQLQRFHLDTEALTANYIKGLEKDFKDISTADDLEKRLNEIQYALGEGFRTGYYSEQEYFDKLAKAYEDYLAKGHDLTVKDAIKTADEAVAAMKSVVERENNKIEVGFTLGGLKEGKTKAQGGFKGLFGDFNAFADILDDADITAFYARQEEMAKAIFSNSETALNNEIDRYKTILTGLTEGTEDYLAVQKKLADAEMSLSDLRTNYEIENLERLDEQEEKLKERRDTRFETYMSLFTTLGDMVGSYADAYEEQLKAEVDGGKISEEAAKKRYKTVQNMQKASTIVNMAAGVVSAIAAAQELGPVAGPIMAAVNSAAVIAAGMAQLKQIENTQFGSSSYTSSPNLAPAVNTYVPTYTQNLTNASEVSSLTNALQKANLQVSVTDINRVQNTVKVRENESTY